MSKLADDDLSPVPPQRHLTAWAFTSGEVLLKSDDTPWRPLVHIEDIARALLMTLAAPPELVHDQAFNVGSTSAK